MLISQVLPCSFLRAQLSTPCHSHVKVQSEMWMPTLSCTCILLHTGKGPHSQACCKHRLCISDPQSPGHWPCFLLTSIWQVLCLPSTSIPDCNYQNTEGIMLHQVPTLGPKRVPWREKQSSSCSLSRPRPKSHRLLAPPARLTQEHWLRPPPLG